AAARSGARRTRPFPRRPRPLPRRPAAGRPFQPDRQLSDQGRLGVRRPGRLPADRVKCCTTQNSTVTPANAGVQGKRRDLGPWIPAFAGMTVSDGETNGPLAVEIGTGEIFLG